MPQPGRPSAGDMTGRQKQQMNKAAREEQAQRSAEISMQDAADAEIDRDGIFDAKSGEQVGGRRPNRVVEVEEVKPHFGNQENGETVLTGQEDPEVVAPVIAAKKTFTAPPTDVVRSSVVTIRVDADVEEMTYGMHNGEPNNFNFKEGLAYRVPLAVAEHLNERGLVRQWMRG
jgi:hypothetical protein